MPVAFRPTTRGSCPTGMIAASGRGRRHHLGATASTPTRSSRRASTCGSARSPIACAPASCPARARPSRSGSTSLKLHEIDLRRRRGAGNRLRLHRAAAGEPGAAGRCRRRRQSEKLDRPPRRLHPRHRRRRARLRPDRGRLSRPALRRDQPAHLPGPGARGLAPVADPLPPRPGAARRCRGLQALHARERLVDDDNADISATASRCRSTSPVRPRTA